MTETSTKTWNPYYPRRHKMLFWLGISASLLMILATVAERTIPLHWRGLMLGSGLSVLLGTAYLTFGITLLVTSIMFIAAVVRLIGQKEKTQKLALWPSLGLHLLALAALFLIPTQHGFAANRQDYYQAVTLLDAERIPPEGMEVPLPDRLKKLSLTGRMVASRKEGALFAYFLLDEVAGEYLNWLVYHSGTRDPRPEDLFKAARVGVAVKKLEEHWFSVLIYKGTGKTEPVESPSNP